MGVMEIAAAIDQIDSCIECDACLDACQTYEATQKEMFSPKDRLQAARKVFQQEEITPEIVDSIYSCMNCERCNLECPVEIDISGVIWRAQVELVKKGIGPLETPNKVMEGIKKLGNTVFGDPAKRWEWLPEEFPKRESDTLFFVGCVPCYLVPQVARSSYLVLKELGVDFMMLQDEGCCGHYFYNLGRLDLAQESFEKGRERFKKLGIKRIITDCPGCQRAFDILTPELAGGENNFEVLNLLQILPELLKERGATPEATPDKESEATYFDPCVFRVMGKHIYDEPREMLNLCGVNWVEMDENREHNLCCGAGGGIATTFRQLSIEVGARFLDKVKTREILTSCPACLLRLNYNAKKREKDKKAFYITEAVLDFLKHSHPS